jgi:hypothetical protein
MIRGRAGARLRRQETCCAKPDKQQGDHTAKARASFLFDGGWLIIDGLKAALTLVTCCRSVSKRAA